ncbi:NADH-quinone oxidoreductase subunit B family protein [Desulfobulbus oligotrophicus]|uniref:Methyl viologen-reducing hydrogenase n=1 Tax=Desulfobulbus oligotrophicus TaxID=1909699 RepID=A0A7T5VE62_9BACT|nr:methyl viologen-reducing hydrogenase [Desulfobulbus oligotrophicus]QQG66107.1 methyl viologen-reducing hydrogenase [Desulfobulbus oligotrophicus]
MKGRRRPRLSFVWLQACSGCEISLLNSGERLPDLLNKVEIVYFPLLMDRKCGGEGEFDLPEADVGFVSGSVSSDEHLTLLYALRRRCRTLVSFGTCATHGGIPALRNRWSAEATLETVFPGTPGQPTLPAEVPALLDRVYSVDEKVRVDFCLPGCPPHPETIAAVIETLVTGEQPRLPGKSVCETCPTIRTGEMHRTVRRFLNNAEYNSEEPVERMRCLLEQGLLCMGPVTVGGCGGPATPLCVQARVPCRGCYGPVRSEGNQLLDMLNVLASHGVDHRSIVDRQSLLRFSGAHGLLRSVRKTEGVVLMSEKGNKKSS